MPVHDWTLVDASVFRGFQGRWASALTTALNTGLLPTGYYADGERIGSPIVVPAEPDDTDETSALLLAAPPRTRRSVSLAIEPPPWHIVIRHVSGHSIVALIEIVSPANKDRAARVQRFADRVVAALSAGVHVLVLDLLPPGRHDPHGIHAVIADAFTGDDADPPVGEPLLFVSYSAVGPRAHIEFAGVGASLPTVPLFLRSRRYVNLPLEPAYQLAFSGTPPIWRRRLSEPT